ncbi:MAG: YqjF family protein [Vicinamibacteraceae bacterium]
MSDDFNSRILHEVAHRPWPMPRAPWIMRQTWHDLLFAHWAVDPARLAGLIPPSLELDLFDRRAWLGVVPFRMTNVAPRGLPALPWLSSFPELNVRTYVRLAGKPGVYFFTLDAGNRLAVRMARALFRLPYHWASMHVEPRGDAIHYVSQRHRDPAARLVATYSPVGPAFHAREGSLEYFLTERYCLYTIDAKGDTFTVEIHHPPWSLQPAAAEIFVNTMADVIGLELGPSADAVARAPILHFAKRQDMVSWWLARTRAAPRSGGVRSI